MTEAFVQQTEANRETMPRACEAWRIEGRSHASGEYAGKQRFVHQVLRWFRAGFAASGDPFRPSAIRSIHAAAPRVMGCPTYAR